MIGLTANVLTRCAPAGSIVSRLGGDEFTILLDSRFDRDDVLGVANEVSKTIRDELLTICDTQITASIGIAFRKSQDHSALEFLQRADAAMYRSKNSGHGLVTVSEDDGNSLSNTLFRRPSKEQEWKNSLVRSQQDSVKTNLSVCNDD